MSVRVWIDGRAADELETYHAVLADLGAISDESDRSIGVFTHSPECLPDTDSAWITPHDTAAGDPWVTAGGVIIESKITDGSYAEDWLRWRGSTVKVRSRSGSDLDPAVFAAFLAHDFPPLDALMLARAYRGRGWPDDLSDYPVPVDAPKCKASFPEFPRNAGLYAVVPTAEWVRRLADLNVPVVQLRDKLQDPDAAARGIAVAVRAVEGKATKLFINDHWKLAIEHGAYGVHLGQEDIETADLNAIRNAGLRLGTSTHGYYEMLRAHACRPSYMALGAVYPTATKRMPTCPQGLRRLKHYVRLMSPHYPLVAIGGIDRSRLEDVWATGVDGAAVLRAIVDAADYRAAATELLAQTPEACLAGRPA